MRAGTRRFGTFVSRSMSSSDNPSEKYSWSFFSLMSTNGRTATDFSGVAFSMDARAGAAAATGCSLIACFASQNLSTTTYPRMAAMIAIMATSGRVSRWLGPVPEECGKKPAASSPTSPACFASPPVEGVSRRCTAAANFGNALSIPVVLASSQCDALRKYSRAGGSTREPMRSDMIGCRFALVRSISRENMRRRNRVFGQHEDENPRLI